jgi:vancomycin resistance protein YoaR
LLLEAEDVFSFWKQVGRASRRRGFVVGRMLQQGCVIPAVGGGLCQLSNALYGLALMSRCEIVERHAHSIRMPGAPVHDATVAWNYVDLRFRVRQRTLIVAKMNEEKLTVGFRFSHAVAGGLAVLPVVEDADAVQVQSCGSCGEVECFRHERR